MRMIGWPVAFPRKQTANSMRFLALTFVFGSVSNLTSANAQTTPKSTKTDASWERLHVEDGITVWRKSIEGSDLVSFRGRTRIEAPAIKLTAILRDSKRSTEWMADCADSRIVSFNSALEAFVYNRTGSQYPFIADRDAVVLAKTKVVENKGQIIVHFKTTTHKAAPPIEGVVRMPLLKGRWVFTQVDEDTTDVDYQILADPGGQLPTWLVNMVSKNLPYKTLRALRGQARAAGYEQEIRILRVAIDWGQFPYPLPSDLGT